MTEPANTIDTTAPKQRRGFATLSPERRREIASAGGRAAQASGNGHRFNSEEARAAGALGGAAAAAIPGQMAAIGRKGGAAVSQDREHMTELGRKGGAVMAQRPGWMQELGRRGGKVRKLPKT